MPLISDDEMYPGFGRQFGGHPEGLIVTRDAFSPPEQRRMSYDPAVASEGLTETTNPTGIMPEVGWTSAATWRSAFKLESPVLAAAEMLSRQNDFGPPEPGHNPLDFIRGTPLEDYRDNFLTSRNLRQTLHIKARIEQELEARRIIEASGWSGVAASMVAGILSPDIFLPFGKVVSGYRLGRAALQTGAHTAAWAGGTIAGQELILQAARETRTFTESMLNIGGGVVLGGLIGGGVSAYGSRRLARASAAIDRDIVEARRLAGIGDAADPFPRTDAVGQPIAGGVAADAGAAVSRTIQENKLAPAFGLEKAFRWTNPLSRLIGSENRAARDAATRLADMPMMLEQNKLGIPTGPEGGSVEARIKIDGDLALYRMQESLQQAFSEHRFQDPQAWFSQSRAWIEGSGPNKLSYQDFKREVTRALRTESPDGGITHAIPEVRKAAEAIRKDVFNVFRDQAKKLGLFPEDTDFLAGYVMRRYDVPKILEEHTKFRDILVDWMSKGQSRVRQELSCLEEELRARQNGGDQSTSEIARLKADIAELRQRWAVDPDLLESHLTAWRFAAKAPPKKPETLAQWIRRNGGIKDAGRDMELMLGSRREAGKLINNKKGSSLDDVALRAWEEGFFGTRADRPTINELLALIDEDVRGGRVIRERDSEGLQSWDLADDLRAELEASGVLAAKNETEARNLMTQWLRRQSQIARRVKQDIEQDRVRLSGLEEQLRRASDPDERQMLKAEIDNLRTQISDAQKALREIDPSSGGGDLYDIAMRQRARRQVTHLQAAIEEALAFGKKITPEGTEIRLAPALRSAAGDLLDATSDTTTGHIQLALSAVDPVAKIGHEAVHTLVTRGHVSPEEVATLANLARETGTFVDELRYREAYKGRPNLESILDEEAAASYIQARLSGAVEGPANTIVERVRQLLERVRQALRGYGFQSREDIVQAIMSGEAARREARADWRRDAVAQGKAEMKAAAERGTTLPDGTEIKGVPLFAIRAFHGSPHDFDRFSMDRIGTGEGAQAFGYGLYFAQSHGVADWYRAQLSDIEYVLDGSAFSGRAGLVDALNGSGLSTVARGQIIARRNLPIDDMIAEIDAALAETRKSGWEPSGEAEALAFLKSGRFQRRPGGRMYEVRIDAEPEDFLDWDKPLAEQSEKVRSAIDARFADADPAWKEGLGYLPMSEVYRLASRADGGRRQAERASATEALRELGVAGIRYLDQGSRTAGEGTSNFVVFDDGLIEIVAKDGEPVAPPFVSRIAEALRSEDLTAVAKSPDGRLFAFAGERAKTADLVSLGAAKWMERTGEDRTAIWEVTGWFKGVDGRWRFEIDDRQARMSLENIVDLEEMPAVQAITHDRLFEAYPDMRDMTVIHDPDAGNAYYPDTDEITVGMVPRKRMLLHEMQHAVQNREGMGEGADSDLVGRDAYRRTASEVEARAVEKRMNLTPEERRARPPWLDYDVPESEQIVRGGEQLFALRDGIDRSREPKLGEALSPATETERAAILAEISKALPAGVGVRFVDSLGAGGDGSRAQFVFSPTEILIRKSLEHGEVYSAVNHELVHALKSLNLYTTAEWQLVVGEARRSLAGKAIHVVDDDGHLLHGPEAYRSHYERQLGDLAAGTPERKALVDDLIDQELVASLMESWTRGERIRPEAATLFERIKAMLERLGNALRGLGFQTADDVLARIAGGEIAAREGDRLRGIAESVARERGSDQLYAMADEPSIRPGAEEPQVSPELWNTVRRVASTLGIEGGDELAARMAGKSFDEQIDALEAFLRKIESAGQKAGRGAEKDMQKILAQMDEMRFYADAGSDELQSIAEETIAKITGSPAGRMINPFDPMFLEGKTGPLQARTLKIPDLFVSGQGHAFADFLDDDIERVASSYVRSMAPDVALAREFGDINMREALRQIQEDADRRTTESPGQSATIQQEARRAQNDLIAIAKRLRGTYNLGQDPTGWSQWTARRVKEWNVLRLMGSVVASSISDPMKLLVTHGFRGNVDLFSTLATNFKGLRVSLDQAKEMSAGLELVMSRGGMLWDAFDDFGGHSRFDQTMQAATKKFGRLTLMDPWNATLKQLSGAMTVNRVLRTSMDLANGRISKTQRAKLAKSGIGPEMAIEIAEQYRKHGGMHGRLWLANANEWDGTDMARRAAAALRAAARREADITIVTPGQERPLWTSGTVGSVIAQFRTFQLVSIQRTLIPAMQELDAAVITGLAGMIALGMLSERLKGVIHGKEDKGPPKTTAEWVYAGVANSGVLGWLTDVDQTLHKVTRGNVSANRILAGSDRPISRFASQNVTGSMLGPSFGAAQDVMTTLGAAATRDVSQADIRAVRRLLPYQNLFWLSRALRAGEQGAMNNLGIPERRAN